MASWPQIQVVYCGAEGAVMSLRMTARALEAASILRLESTKQLTLVSRQSSTVRAVVEAGAVMSQQSLLIDSSLWSSYLKSKMQMKVSSLWFEQCPTEGVRRLVKVWFKLTLKNSKVSGKESLWKTSLTWLTQDLPIESIDLQRASNSRNYLSTCNKSTLSYLGRKKCKKCCCPDHKNRWHNWRPH